jgi:mono/diheme cytochrome c family protein
MKFIDRQSGRSAALILGGLLICLTCATACRQDMHDQPKLIPLREGSARPLVEGTVPRGSVRENQTVSQSTAPTGQTQTTETQTVAGAADVFPFPITEDVLKRGHERFNIYCAPCHSQIGDGNGMIVQRGFRRPPSYHIDRLRQAPASHFFDVVTNGFGAMPSYAEQIPSSDRWAIIAYIRALQLSQNAPISELTPDQKQRLNAGGQQK